MALAESVKAEGVIVITRRGITADDVTAARPQGVPIFAFTNDSQTRRRLALNRSVHPHRIAFSSDPEKTLKRAFDVLRKKEGIEPDAKLVVISDVLTDQPTEAIQIRRLH